MKGVLLAGGTGSRLHPLNLVTNKHLLPVHDRPMIYYPLQTLRAMGIEKVMVILGGRNSGDVVELLSDGRDFGLDLTYRYQRGAHGVAQAIGLARDFVGNDAFCAVLGDNILRGESLEGVAREFEQGRWGAGALLCRVPHPERYGVAGFDDSGTLMGFEEKPVVPKSDMIPIGAYFLRPDAFDVIERLEPSGRGEFEITDVLNHYLRLGSLFCRRYEGEWADAGTIESLLDASLMASRPAGASAQGRPGVAPS
jgi:glucose-1-phosphate thymidylyltransferase